jgi:hypothetical protein
MFNFKSIATTTIVLSSFLVQQSVTAYPKASEKSEISYLKSMLISNFGQSAPVSNINRYVEENHRNKSNQDALIVGYSVCDDIRTANKKGISGNTLLTQEISNLNSATLPTTEKVLTKEQLIDFYNNAKNNLCPNLY